MCELDVVALYGPIRVFLSSSRETQMGACSHHTSYMWSSLLQGTFFFRKEVSPSLLKIKLHSHYSTA